MQVQQLEKQLEQREEECRREREDKTRKQEEVRDLYQSVEQYEVQFAEQKLLMDQCQSRLKEIHKKSEHQEASREADRLYIEQLQEEMSRKPSQDSFRYQRLEDRVELISQIVPNGSNLFNHSRDDDTLDNNFISGLKKSNSQQLKTIQQIDTRHSPGTGEKPDGKVTTPTGVRHNTVSVTKQTPFYKEGQD